MNIEVFMHEDCLTIWQTRVYYVTRSLMIDILAVPFIIIMIVIVTSLSLLLVRGSSLLLLAYYKFTMTYFLWLDIVMQLKIMAGVILFTVTFLFLSLKFQITVVPYFSRKRKSKLNDPC